MIDIIKWLQEIEIAANKLYIKAAKIYANEQKYKTFFENAAEDEALHYHLLENAERYLVSKPAPIPAISVDETIRNKIAHYFKDLKNGLEENTLSKDELIEKIAEGELSEWNDIFLYVINVLKEHIKEFKSSAAKIQAHIKQIENFLEETGNCSETLKKIKALPPVWVENILIVDDDQNIKELIKVLLNPSGNIDFANNGREALKLIEEKFYKLIISDIDMPIMDGLSLFKEAVIKYPKLKKRFLFISGYISRDKEAFFNENNIKYLTKPMGIADLRKEASKIILSS